MSLLQFYQVIAVDVVTAIIAISPLFFIAIPQPVRSDAVAVVTPRTLARDVAEGFRYLKNWRAMLYIVLTAALLNFLLTPSGTLMPLMVTQVFKGDVWKLSLLESMMGIGIVAGGLTIGVWGGFKNRIITVLLGVIGIGLGVLVFGLAPANLFWLAVVGRGITGFMSPIANGPLHAIMQSKIEPEMQGRVMGLTNSLCMMMMPIALLIAAPVAEWIGLRVWYWAGGALVMIIGALSFTIRDVAQLESSKPSIQTQVAASEQAA